MYIHVDKCSRCPRTETCRWYGKETDSPYCASCYRKEYVANNREKALAAQRKANASETSKEARKAYAQTKAGRIAKRKYDNKFAKENPEKVREKRKRLRGYYKEVSTRRNRQLEKASLGNISIDETIKIYHNCPDGYHVDHIVPVKAYDMRNGKREHVACGLHVSWNLQYLPAKKNLEKSCNLYSLEDLP